MESSMGNQLIIQRLTSADLEKAEWGYVLSNHYWNKGITT